MGMIKKNSPGCGGSSAVGIGGFFDIFSLVFGLPGEEKTGGCSCDEEAQCYKLTSCADSSVIYTRTDLDLYVSKYIVISGHSARYFVEISETCISPVDVTVVRVFVACPESCAACFGSEASTSYSIRFASDACGVIACSDCATRFNTNTFIVTGSCSTWGGSPGGGSACDGNGYSLQLAVTSGTEAKVRLTGGVALETTWKKTYPGLPPCSAFNDDEFVPDGTPHTCSQPGGSVFVTAL